MSEEEDRMTSTPAEAKVATARGNAKAHVIAQLTEIVVFVGACCLLWNQSITENTWLMVAGAVTIGPGIGRARGKIPMASTVTLIALAPSFAKLGLIAGVLSMSGCGAVGAQLLALAPEVMKLGGEALKAHAQNKGVAIAEDKAWCMIADEDTLESYSPPDRDPAPIGFVCVGYPLK